MNKLGRLSDSLDLIELLKAAIENCHARRFHAQFYLLFYSNLNCCQQYINIADQCNIVQIIVDLLKIKCMIMCRPMLLVRSYEWLASSSVILVFKVWRLLQSIIKHRRPTQPCMLMYVTCIITVCRITIDLRLLSSRLFDSLNLISVINSAVSSSTSTRASQVFELILQAIQSGMQKIHLCYY